MFSATKKRLIPTKAHLLLCLLDFSNRLATLREARTRNPIIGGEYEFLSSCNALQCSTISHRFSMAPSLCPWSLFHYHLYRKLCISTTGLAECLGCIISNSLDQGLYVIEETCGQGVCYQLLWESEFLI